MAMHLDNGELVDGQTVTVQELARLNGWDEEEAEDLLGGNTRLVVMRFADGASGDNKDEAPEDCETQMTDEDDEENDEDDEDQDELD